ncbi:MAG: hypothetical protein EOP00_27325 [Pedobacter sp.]|nr:MAG: hypothetical protein EOP00_27325 [Pedobacter sp.]
MPTSNGVIYTIQGDGVNATLSFAATIPIAGWTATTAKYVRKTVILSNGAKRTLVWQKNAAGVISFGDRGLLRKVLGLAVGDARKAHHVMPWEHCSEDIIQKAAGGDFHMNELLNGIPLTTAQHSGSHALYNQKVGLKLQELWNLNPNMSSQQAQTAVRNLAAQIKNWIYTHPNESINNVIIP